MPKPSVLALLLGLAPLLGVTIAPAMAQTPAPSAPAPSTPATTTPAGVTATTGNPNLAVSSIKLETGKRLSQIIGAPVYGQDNKELGKVDDLVLTGDNQITLAVVSVGGFLGVGSKLVAFPFKQLASEGGRMTLPGVTADQLNAMPNFQY